ncbi:EF-hand domain-containing protein [Desulfocurvibacter africanus]|uniref:EF-hand domain-containing protein n=1 Tax=Desulfocurvibacter africanus TaxID=873 RepID=UPI000420E681|nr:EF-hand domain-containing protein [Desulfocurvibacter africanus]
MKRLLLSITMAAAVASGPQAFAATTSPMNETGQEQTTVGSEVETGQQVETAAPAGDTDFEAEGTDERSGGTGSSVTGLKGESLAGDEAAVQERSATEPQEPFSAIDTDGDGKLSLSEARTAFEQADKDGSGTVDFGEYRDAMPNIGVGTTEMGATEGDASAGEAERGAQESQGQSSGQAMRAQEQGDEEFQPGEPVKLSDVDQPGRDSSATDAPFAMVDEDRDGQLTPEEVVGAFRQADQDRDRQLSSQEWQQTMSRFGASSGASTIDMGSESGDTSEGQGTSEMGASESDTPSGQQERSDISVPDTVSEQQGDPSAGDPAYLTDEKESTSERSSEEIPTVDPLAGKVPGTGGALESESEAMGIESGTLDERAAGEAPRSDDAGQTPESIVDQQPGNEQLLTPEAERSEEAVDVMSDQAPGETQSSDEARRLIESPEEMKSGAEGTAERATTEGQEAASEQWTGSPDPQKAKEGAVKDWQDYEKTHERAIVRQPESQPGGQAEGQQQ